MRLQARRVPAIAAVIGLLTVTAACGDDDEGSSGSSEPAAAATTAVGASTATDASGDSAPSTAANGTAASTPSGGGGDVEQAVQALTARPTEITNTTPIEADIPADRTIAWIQCPTPACVQLGQPMEEAATALGWTLQIIQHEGTPESVKAAYQEAITAGVDGVVGSGFPRVVFEEELQQLAANDVPVVEITVTDPPEDGLTAVVNGPARNAEVGIQLATAVTADSGGAANVLWVTAPYPILEPELKGLDGTGGFEPELGRLCENCEVSVLDIPADAVGKDAPARIVGHLQANPDVDYVVGAFSDLVFGLPGALSDAGLSDQVKIITYTQGTAMSAALEQGEVQAVVGFPGPENTWQAIDVMARVFAGVEHEGEYSDLPSWIITADNVPSTTEDYPLVEDYQAQYKALWGVS